MWSECVSVWRRSECVMLIYLAINVFAANEAHDNNNNNQIQFCKSIIMWKFIHYITLSACLPASLYPHFPMASAKHHHLQMRRRGMNISKCCIWSINKWGRDECAQKSYSNESTGFWEVSDGSVSFIFVYFWVVYERAHQTIERKKNQLYVLMLIYHILKNKYRTEWIIYFKLMFTLAPIIETIVMLFSFDFLVKNTIVKSPPKNNFFF